MEYTRKDRSPPPPSKKKNKKNPTEGLTSKMVRFEITSTISSNNVKRAMKSSAARIRRIIPE